MERRFHATEECEDKKWFQRFYSVFKLSLANIAYAIFIVRTSVLQATSHLQTIWCELFRLALIRDEMQTRLKNLYTTNAYVCRVCWRFAK